MCFNHFPFTCYHSLNLDWFLNKFKNIEETSNKAAEDAKKAADSAGAIEGLANEAKESANNAVETANEAKKNATSAKNMASTANTSVNNLKNTVDRYNEQYSQHIRNAREAAENAATSAENAATSAENAATSAENAVEVANNASNKADNMAAFLSWPNTEEIIRKKFVYFGTMSTLSAEYTSNFSVNSLFSLVSVTPLFVYSKAEGFAYQSQYCNATGSWLGTIKAEAVHTGENVSDRIPGSAATVTIKFKPNSNEFNSLLSSGTAIGIFALVEYVGSAE